MWPDWASRQFGNFALDADVGEVFGKGKVADPLSGQTPLRLKVFAVGHEVEAELRGHFRPNPVFSRDRGIWPHGATARPILKQATVLCF